MVLDDKSSGIKYDTIRNEFFKTFNESVGMGKYHKSDLDRLRRDNQWIKAFYKYSQESQEKAVNMLDEVLAWRNEFGSNDLIIPGKPPVTEEIFKKGGLFYKNEDKNNTKLLHFIVKTHKKENYSQVQVQQFISYFFESVYKFNLDDPIVLLFDMSDTGYSNLDMDMIKFVVNCLKTYYPGLIDYMIIYQMPFIFNAAWKIIKNWLPPSSVNLIKFCDKKSIKEYIDESQLFVHMGGTDSYKYVYDSDIFNISLNDSGGSKESTASDTKLESYELIPNGITESKFEQIKPMIVENQGKSLIAESIAVASTDDQMSIENTDNISPQKMTNSNQPDSNYKIKENTLKTNLLTISPGDELIFNVTDGIQDITQFINLTNTSGTYLAYKIKITSPDKFRVKPGTGIIPTSSNAQIMINFLKEFHSLITNQKDKFLILWAPIDQNLQNSDLTEFWKKTVHKKQNIKEHKVKCVIRNNNVLKNSSNTNLNVKTTNQSTLPVSPSTTSVNNYFNSNENSIRRSDMTEKNKKVDNLDSNSLIQTDLLTNSSSPEISKTKPLNAELSEPKTKPKIDKVETSNIIQTKEENILRQSRRQHYQQNSPQSDNQFSIKETNQKIDKLQKNIDSINENQKKITKQYTEIIYLIYFIILLNILQFFFQSDYIDSVLFD